MLNYGPAAAINLRVEADAQALAAVAAEVFSMRATAAIEASGRFAVALSGGSTPHLLFAELSRCSELEQSWHDIHVFWSDERFVLPTDPASNYRSAKERLLDYVPIPAANIHRIRTEDLSRAAALSYELELRKFFCLASGDWPRFDLVLLGLGEDGHTASLFPYSRALRETARLVATNDMPAAEGTRITLTLPVINTAACVLVLACGARKSAIAKLALETTPSPEALPMQGVLLHDGQILWILDVAAASTLQTNRQYDDAFEGKWIKL